jgi:type II secretory pathway component PulC
MMALRHPQLAELRELRKTLAEMREIKLTVGRDGRNRTLLSPVPAQRPDAISRAPQSSSLVFLPGHGH